MQDPYHTLGISSRSSQAEIKQNYRRLAKELHPDRQPGSATAAEKFKEIAAAYHVLGDAKQRSRFDRGEIDANGNRRAGYQPPPPKQERPASDNRRGKTKSSSSAKASAGSKSSTKAGAKTGANSKGVFGEDNANSASGQKSSKGSVAPGPKSPEMDATVKIGSFNNFGFSGFSASDIFQPFFRKDKKSSAENSRASDLDRHCKLEIGLLDAIKGGKKRLTLVPG